MLVMEAKPASPVVVVGTCGTPLSVAALFGNCATVGVLYTAAADGGSEMAALSHC